MDPQIPRWRTLTTTSSHDHFYSRRLSLPRLPLMTSLTTTFARATRSLGATAIDFCTMFSRVTAVRIHNQNETQVIQCQYNKRQL